MSWIEIVIVIIIKINWISSYPWHWKHIWKQNYKICLMFLKENSKKDHHICTELVIAFKKQTTCGVSLRTHYPHCCVPSLTWTQRSTEFSTLVSASHLAALGLKQTLFRLILTTPQLYISNLWDARREPVSVCCSTLEFYVEADIFKKRKKKKKKCAVYVSLPVLRDLLTLIMFLKNDPIKLQ